MQSKTSIFLKSEIRSFYRSLKTKQRLFSETIVRDIYFRDLVIVEFMTSSWAVDAFLLRTKSRLENVHFRFEQGEETTKYSVNDRSVCRWFSAYCRISKNLKNGFIASIWYQGNLSCKLAIIPKFGLKFELLSINFDVTTWLHSLFRTLKTQFSQKEEVGSYDFIALNQRCSVAQIETVSEFCWRYQSPLHLQTAQ